MTSWRPKSDLRGSSIPFKTNMTFRLERHPFLAILIYGGFAIKIMALQFPKFVAQNDNALKPAWESQSIQQAVVPWSTLDFRNTPRSVFPMHKALLRR